MHASRVVPGATLNNVYAPKTQEDYQKQVLALLDKYNIHAITSGDDSVLAYWKMKSPGRIFPSRMVWSPQQINISELKKELISKKWMAIGEVCSQYQGLAPNDTCLEKIYALAEEMNTPLGIHIGIGDTHVPTFRVSLTHPLLLEEVLVKHPKLRLYVMHAGYPMIDEMIALLFEYPQLYVDVAVDDWILSKKEFYYYLKRLVDAGFGKRIMYGSDQMMWPGAIELSIKSIQDAPFLTENQKRDIFYNNAVRFFNLKTEDFVSSK